MRVIFPGRNLEQIVAELQRRLPALQAMLPVRRVVLFGSWAKGRATAYSDVDVLIVYDGPPRDEAYRLAWHQLPIRGLELHVYSEAEAAALAPTLERMTGEGITIFDTGE